MSIKPDRSRPEPLYHQIRDWMRQQVTTGAWPEHYKLPSEFELVERFSVNRGTVRKAIADLIAEGLLVSIHGRGTFVSSRTLEQPLAEDLITFSEDLIRKGIPFETTVLACDVRKPPSNVAALLRINPNDDIFYLRRVRIVRQAPLALIENFVPYAVVAGIERVDFTVRGLFETLEKQYEVTLSWGQRTFQAQLADADTMTMLGIDPAIPIMYIEQLTYRDEDTPVELSNIWLRGDRFRLSAVVNRNSISRFAKSRETVYLPVEGAVEEKEL
ncbi:MAG: GntR family transcriptional regulator [Anaerolineae bacterium]|nr:GntR family transcriptional regulator [Anaerolineae bacterium]